MMSNCFGEILEKRETSDEKEVQWKIPNFRSLPINTCVKAPVFKFLASRWYLGVNSCDTDRRIALHLCPNRLESSYNMSCTFGFENSDGSLVGTRSFYHTFCSRKPNFIARLFSRRELLQRVFELMPSNILTIVCKLKLLDHPRHLTELDTLSGNLKDVFLNNEFSDTTLYVKDKEFKAHKAVLAVRSPVFAAMFKHETSEKLTGVINIPDFEPDLFQEFLKYLYSGKVEIMSLDSAFHLYLVADKYDVRGLKMFCVEYMQQNMKSENVQDIIVLAEEHNESDLLAVAKNYFDKNHSEIEEVVDGISDLKINL